MPVKDRIKELLELGHYYINNNSLYNKRGKEIKGSLRKDGYIGLTLKDYLGEFSCMYHQVIWIGFYGIYPPTLQINHIDGNKKNNFLYNLELVTPKENVVHSIINGLKIHKSGINWWRSKIKNQYIIDEIRSLYKSGWSQRKLSTKYGICQSNISRIINRKRYK